MISWPQVLGHDIITHRFALDDYREAFMACYRQGGGGAVKVLFEELHGHGSGSGRP